MVSLTQWTWVWASSGSWWWTGKPGLLQSMGSQRVGHKWETKLNWSYETNLPASRFTKESTCQWRRCWRCRLNPWIRKIPWRRKWQHIPVFLPQKAHAQRSLESYSPWSGRSWTWLTDSAHTHRFIGRGECSFLVFHNKKSVSVITSISISSGSAARNKEIHIHIKSQTLPYRWDTVGKEEENKQISSITLLASILEL